MSVFGPVPDVAPVRTVSVRLLPGRPRWRSIRQSGPDLGLAGLGDDPVSAVLGLIALIVLLPFVLAALFGVALLSLEMLLLLPLGALAGARAGVRPAAVGPHGDAR